MRYKGFSVRKLTKETYITLLVKTKDLEDLNRLLVKKIRELEDTKA
jgi:hypothetical protein